MIPSLKLTLAGSLPPSCKYLCTASRPVNNTPLISTASPTLSERIFSSVNGIVSFVMGTKSVEPFLNFSAGLQYHPLPPVGPAHVTDAHKKRGGHSVDGADLHAEQGRFATETHRPDPEIVGRF